MRIFVSHASQDLEWAKWAAAHVRRAGYDVDIDLDWTGSWADEMRRALEECQLMVALFSANYFANTYTMMELNGWIARSGGAQGLIPARIGECAIPNLYKPYIYVDLHKATNPDQLLIEKIKREELALVRPRPAGDSSSAANPQSSPNTRPANPADGGQPNPQAPPPGVAAWHVYVGTEPDAMWRQNAEAIEPDTPWIQTGVWLSEGVIANGGQDANYFHAIPRVIPRSTMRPAVEINP